MSPSLESILTCWIKTRLVNGKWFVVKRHCSDWCLVVSHDDLRRDLYLSWDGPRGFEGSFGAEAASFSVQPSDPSFFPKLTEWLRRQVKDIT